MKMLPKIYAHKKKHFLAHSQKFMLAKEKIFANFLPLESFWS